MNKINQIQGLRFFALSGFILIYVYKEKGLKYDFKSSILFTYNKIKKLYPLLIITYVFGFIFCFYTGVTHDYIKEGIIPFICDCLLLQSYYHGQYIGLLMNFNVVAWYLSTALFLYFCFPFILSKIKSISKVKTILFCIFLIFILMIIFCYLVRKSYLVEYFVYVFPVLRLGDFLIGCLFGVLFTLNVNINKKLSNVFSILIILYIVSLQILWIVNKDIFALWYKDTLLFVLPASFLIYLLSNNDCFLSKLLSLKFFVYLGNLSGFAFLIHTIIIRYFFYIFRNVDFTIINKFIIYIVLLILTFLVSILYLTILKKYNDLYKN